MGCGASSDAAALAPPPADVTSTKPATDSAVVTKPRPTKEDKTTAEASSSSVEEAPVGQPYDVVDAKSTAEIHCTVMPVQIGVHCLFVAPAPTVCDLVLVFCLCSDSDGERVSL